MKNLAKDAVLSMKDCHTLAGPVPEGMEVKAYILQSCALFKCRPVAFHYLACPRTIRGPDGSRMRVSGTIWVATKRIAVRPRRCKWLKPDEVCYIAPCYRKLARARFKSGKKVDIAIAFLCAVGGHPSTRKARAEANFNSLHP